MCLAYFGFNYHHATWSRTTELILYISQCQFGVVFGSCRTQNASQCSFIAFYLITFTVNVQQNRMSHLYIYDTIMICLCRNVFGNDFICASSHWKIFDFEIVCKKMKRIVQLNAITPHFVLFCLFFIHRNCTELWTAQCYRQKGCRCQGML